MNPSLLHLQEKIGYHFRQVKLLETAMTHSSWVNENHTDLEHNERLEFLGDAVLELCISEILFNRFPDKREGELTQLRSRLVNKPSLAEMARSLEIENCLRLGKGEETQGGRERNSLLGDAFEAALGAIFIDGGYEAAASVTGSLFADYLPDGAKTLLRKDNKSRLQELTQKKYHTRPIYTLQESSGPEHEKVFTVRLTLSGEQSFIASGPSVKRAEQDAAQLALDALEKS